MAEVLDCSDGSGVPSGVPKIFIFIFLKVNIFSVIQKTKTNPPDYDMSDANVKPEKLL